MPQPSDLRSIPNRILNAYLWPLGAWGVGLLFLFATGNTLYAITLCYPLALWFGGLSLWWGLKTVRRLREGDLARSEVDAGVRSIGRILAGASVTPAMVFLAVEPLEPGTWGTCAGVAIVGGLAWGAANVLPQLGHRAANGIALSIAWAALPINATGAASLAFFLGWFDSVRGAVGV